MNIDKKNLKIGYWFTDEDGNRVPWDDESYDVPEGAVYAHTCYPLEVVENIYKIRKDGDFGEKDKVVGFSTHISRNSGKLIVAMVNSGDYELDEAIGVYAHACERCMNVLWNKYLPGEDGYAEFSEEWKKCNTLCDFCKDLSRVAFPTRTITRDQAQEEGDDVDDSM